MPIFARTSGKSSKEIPVKAPMAHSGLQAQVDWKKCPPTIPSNITSLLRTLRNGFAHFHWRYDDLSARDYWDAQNWSTQGAPIAFELNNRPPKNYMTYIADGNGWAPNRFWNLRDLRILATPLPCLRYFLHLNLQQLLNNARVNVFGNPV
ncbi:hypothetical protein [Bradyrhizobium sp. I71]|uniref:hypothetical protein n=1 Tax=Bradyrhizobium sp. I71 TaxID=2590772 RepID=UPI001EF76CA4|nr:hypothetical protein [Bradyrhizobium sp. I71]ULK98488.1 hypothetical protein FJV43_01610 [Bradyrhizobium sp. I71]